MPDAKPFCCHARMLPYRALAWLLLLLLVQLPARAETSPEVAPPVVWLEQVGTSFDIGTAVDYVVESTPLAPADLAQASWQRYAGKTINLRHQRAPVWFRFDLASQHPRQHEWLLEVPWPLLDLIELRVFDHTTQRWSDVQYGGNRTEMAVRNVRHRNYLFPLVLPEQGQATVYLRVQSLSHFNLPLTLWQSDIYLDRDQKDMLLLGMLLGTLVVMLLYNLSLYLFTRDKSYFFYSAYVFAILFFVLSVTGVGAQYVWPDNSWMRRHSFSVSAPFAYITAALFVRQFLSLQRYGGWLLHLNTVIVFYWVFTFAVSIAGMRALQHVMLALSDLVGALSGIAGLVTTIVLWRRGNVSAKYFTIAWSLLIGSNMMFALMLAGVLERNAVTVNSQLYGFVVEAVLLSLVLAERINRERFEREKAQAQALLLSQQIREERDAKLAVQAEALVMQQAANATLEARVRERTAELEVAVEAVERFNLELRKLSITDSLTGVFNRHFFEKTCADELSRAARLRHPLSVLLIDVDHFKRINDSYGHLAGDDCLKCIASALRAGVTRAGDVVARYGGEEFVVLLPNTDAGRAILVGEELRRTIEQLDFVAQDQRVALSASVGVAGWVPIASERFETLLSAADNALYSAKRLGRNRVVLAGTAAIG